MAVTHFLFFFPIIVLELCAAYCPCSSPLEHTQIRGFPRRPSHTQFQQRICHLPHLTRRLHLPFTACMANTAEGPWKRLSWEGDPCSNLKELVIVILYFNHKCKINEYLCARFIYLHFVGKFSWHNDMLLTGKRKLNHCLLWLLDINWVKQNYKISNLSMVK